MFLLSSRGERPTRIDLPGGVVGIRNAVADADGEALWVLSGAGEELSLIWVTTPLDPGHTVAGATSWQIQGNWRAVSTKSGHLTAVSTRRPFEVLEVTLGEARPHHLMWLAEEMEALPSPDSAEVFLVGLAGLDCGGILATFGDIRSDRRWLVVFNPQANEIISQTAVESFMGFFGARPDQRRAFAYRATSEGGELLVYEWSWEAQRDTN